MLPQVIDSLRPAASPHALPVGAGEPAEDRDVSLSAQLVHPWVLAQAPPGGWRRAGGGTFSAPQEATGELAAVQRALEKGHWKKD